MANQGAGNNAISIKSQDVGWDFIDYPRKPKTNKFAFGCAALASLTSVLLGYYFGSMSGAIIYIKKELKISEVKVEVFLGIFNFYSLIGSLAGGKICDGIGRRYTILLSGFMFLIGAVLMACANSYAFLTASNLAASIGVGLAFMIAPVYTAEVSPASFRGLLATFPEIFMNVGLLLGYIASYAFSRLPQHLAWRLMLAAGAIPSVFLILGILVMPESPRWLVMQGRLAEAKQVLDQTSDSKEEADLRLADIIQAATAGFPLENIKCPNGNDVVLDDPTNIPTNKNKIDGGNVVKDLLLHPTPSVLHILIAAAGINFFRQSSGVDVTLLYGPAIFEKAGFSSDNKLIATIAIGVVKLVFVLVATFFIDKIGRRPLLLTSMMGSFISLMGLGVGLTYINRSSEKIPWAIALCVTTILTNTAFFSIGIGPITWVYSSEIFPLRLRSVGTSVAVAVNRVTSGVIIMTFITLSKAITIGGTFFFYAGFALLGWVFFYTMLPETKGRTLEEMQGYFGNFFIWRTPDAVKKKQLDEDKFDNHG